MLDFGGKIQIYLLSLLWEFYTARKTVKWDFLRVIFKHCVII